LTVPNVSEEITSFRPRQNYTQFSGWANYDRLKIPRRPPSNYMTNSCVKIDRNVNCRFRQGLIKLLSNKPMDLKLRDNLKLETTVTFWSNLESHYFRRKATLTLAIKFVL